MTSLTFNIFFWDYWRELIFKLFVCIILSGIYNTSLWSNHSFWDHDLNTLYSTLHKDVFTKVLTSTFSSQIQLLRLSTVFNNCKPITNENIWDSIWAPPNDYDVLNFHQHYLRIFPSIYSIWPNPTHIDYDLSKAESSIHEDAYTYIPAFMVAKTEMMLPRKKNFLVNVSSKKNILKTFFFSIHFYIKFQPQSGFIWPQKITTEFYQNFIYKKIGFLMF